MVSPSEGTVLHDRYLLDRELAEGATATVWIGVDQLLNRAVAIKVLHGHLIDNTDHAGRFADEARVAATVAHPNLVAVYDAVPGPPPAIIMELIDGPDLRQRLAQGPLSVGEALSLGAPIADALDAAHRRGLVHRDVKPGNVMITRDGRPKLGDFGIATLQAGNRTATGIVLGTAKYLAPEQVRGDTIDARTDVYALCVTLYEALCGTVPFERDGDLPTAMARLEEAPAPIRSRRSDIPTSLEAIVLRGLAREPEARWPSAGAVRDALTDQAEELGYELGAIYTRESSAAPRQSSLPPPASRESSLPPPSQPRAPSATPAGIGDPDGGSTTARLQPKPPSSADPAADPSRPPRRWLARILFGLFLGAIAVLGWVLITDGGDGVRSVLPGIVTEQSRGAAIRAIPGVLTGGH